MKPDIAIAGGGIVGLCCALQLQRHGLVVTLVDPGDPRRACSFGNAGQLAVGEVVPLSAPGIMYSALRALRDPLGPLAIQWRYLPQLAPWLLRFLMAGRRARAESISSTMASLCDLILPDFEPLLAAAGASGLVIREDYLRIYEDFDQWRSEGYSWKLRERAGLRYEKLDAATLHARVPEINPRFGFAVALKGRYYIDGPERLSVMLREHFVNSGGQLLNGEVAGFEHLGDRVAGFRLTNGTSLPAEKLVLAAGIWSKPLAHRLGDALPLESERGYHVMVPHSGLALRGTLSCPAHGLVVVPMEHGLCLAGTLELASRDAAPEFRHCERLVKSAKMLLPGLDAADASCWMGHRPSFPDSLPVIDRATRHSNVFYSFGHGHMGLSWAATTGRLISDLVLGRAPSMDLAPFSASRFAGMPFSQ